MAANVCQTKKMEERDLKSLCASCANDGGCIWQHHAAHVVARAEGDDYHEVVVDACGFFRDPGRDDGSIASPEIYRTALFEAKIHDLCQGCPSSLDGSCATRRDLDEITRLSDSYGEPGWVHVSMVTCKSKRGGLHQISEPKTD